MQTGQKPALPRWGFSHLGRQTECERIPRPRKYQINSDQRHLCASRTNSESLRIRPCGSSQCLRISSYFLGRLPPRSGSNEWPRFHCRFTTKKGTSGVCFVSAPCAERLAERGLCGAASSPASNHSKNQASSRPRAGGPRVYSYQSASPCCRSTDHTFA